MKNVMQSIQLTVRKERVYGAEDAIKDIEQEEEDPTYVPESVGESDFSEEVHFSTAVRKTNTEAANTATKLPSTTESSIIEPGKSTQTTRQRPMSPAADDSAATQTPSKKIQGLLGHSRIAPQNVCLSRMWERRHESKATS